jgi:hypothetical protein
VTDPYGSPGHGPSDPFDYQIEQVSGGYRWTCLIDGDVGGPFPDRADAVRAAERDRSAKHRPC